MFRKLLEMLGMREKENSKVQVAPTPSPTLSEGDIVTLNSMLTAEHFGSEPSFSMGLWVDPETGRKLAVDRKHYGYRGDYEWRVFDDKTLSWFVVQVQEVEPMSLRLLGQYGPWKASLIKGRDSTHV